MAVMPRESRRWLTWISPDDGSVTVRDLVDGRYVETGRPVGTEEIVVERPFPLVIKPSALVSG